MLVLTIGIATAITSCKKDKETEKQRVEKLLVSGKWYWHAIAIISGSGNTTHSCFNANDYWEFKADGTWSERGWWNATTGNSYTVSADGKTVTLKFNTGAVTDTLFEINDEGFAFIGKNDNVIYAMSKTAGACSR